MKIMIVGGSGETPYILRSLAALGHSVTVINRDAEECARLSRMGSAVIVHGDGTIPGVLEDAGITSMDKLLALTPRDEDNYVLCRIGKCRYGVPAVFAVVHDPDNEAVFRELGIGSTFSITAIVSSLIEQRSASMSIRRLQPLADGKIAVTEVVLPEGAPSAGKALRELRFPENSLIVSVLRQEEVLVPNGETVLHPGDVLSFVSLPDRYERTLETLVGSL